MGPTGTGEFNSFALSRARNWTFSLPGIGREVHSEHNQNITRRKSLPVYHTVHPSSYQRRKYSCRAWLGLSNVRCQYFHSYHWIWLFFNTCRHAWIRWLPRRCYWHRHPWKNSGFLAAPVRVIYFMFANNIRNKSFTGEDGNLMESFTYTASPTLGWVV